MTLNIFALKNRLSGIFERPFCEIYNSSEYPELLAQSLALASVEELNRHKEFDLYFLGTFDSKSGVVQSLAPEFVVCLEPLCTAYMEVKKSKEIEVSKNVGEKVESA